MQVQVLRDGSVDELEEPQEFLVAVPAVWLGDHRPAAHTEHLMAEQRSPGAEHMFGQPIDIAMTVRFLVSKPARFWTGQVVCLNGS